MRRVLRFLFSLDLFVVVGDLFFPYLSMSHENRRRCRLRRRTYLFGDVFSLGILGLSVVCCSLVGSFLAVFFGSVVQVLGLLLV